MAESIIRRVLKARLEIAGIALILYAAIAVKGELLASKGDELFPFFTWSLFSYPEKTRTHFWIYVPDPDGAGGMSETEISAYRDPERFTKAVGKMGNIFQSAGIQSAAFREQRRSVENYLRPVGIKEYALVRRSYDVIEYLRDRTVLKVEPLSRFTVPEVKD